MGFWTCSRVASASSARALRELGCRVREVAEPGSLPQKPSCLLLLAFGAEHLIALFLAASQAASWYCSDGLAQALGELLAALLLGMMEAGGKFSTKPLS